MNDKTPSDRHLVAWPAVSTESQAWVPPAGYGYTRRERTPGTYRSAIPAKIADTRLSLPGSLAADAEEAAAAISRFDATAAHQFGTVTTRLIRSEAASSSQIEQITASARAVAEAEATGAGSGNAAVISANTRAMLIAIDSASEIQPETLVNMQRVLLADHSPAMVGWRKEPVWIGGVSSTPMTADFVAPDHRRVCAAIADLVDFIRRDDLPVLPQAAIAHAQFETIHPFADGSGRTGRALVHAILRGKSLTESATVPLSGGLLSMRASYFDALGAYRRGDAGPIIDIFNRASLAAVSHGTDLAERLTSIRTGWENLITARSDSALHKLLDALPSHPVVDAELAATLTGSDTRNVHRHLRRLADAGIVVGSKHFKSRRYLYRAPDVLRALDQYAEIVGRRQR